MEVNYLLVADVVVRFNYEKKNHPIQPQKCQRET